MKSEKENIHHFDITNETIITFDPPTPDYPVYLIAYFKDLGYCIYKELNKDHEEQTTVKDIENSLGYNKANSQNSIPREKIIIDDVNKSFFLLKTNQNNVRNCIDIIQKMWDSFDKANEQLARLCR
ncbi:hypothetical protein [Bacillus velezensis]